MKKTNDENQWQKDYQEFLALDSAVVPAELSQKIKNVVHSDLNPSSFLIFGKLLSLHALIGTLSLAFCNQFGMNPFGTSFSLTDYFMHFGHSICMMMCGILFLGLSTSMTAMMLRPEELRVLRKNIWFQNSLLVIFSLMAFVLAGAEIAGGILLLWALGAMLGGVSSNELVYRLRINLIRA